MSEVLACRRLRGEAKPEIIDALQDEFDVLWEDASFVTEADRMTFSTAVVEVASNGVQHSVGSGDRPVELGVELTVTRNRLQASVSEYGAVEAPAGAQGEAAALELPAEDMESGRGLHLVRALVTTVVYERRDGANIWTLRKNTAS
jgi:serine/threonine-protein kinase RsbW